MTPDELKMAADLLVPATSSGEADTVPGEEEVVESGEEEVRRSVDVEEVGSGEEEAKSREELDEREKSVVEGEGIPAKL